MSFSNPTSFILHVIHPSTAVLVGATAIRQRDMFSFHDPVPSKTALVI